jgi:RNA exonuclease 1
VAARLIFAQLSMSDENNHNNQAGKYGSGENGRKRKREDRQESLNLGVGSTLGLLQQPDLPEFNLTTEKPASRLSRGSDNEVQSHNPEEWETVEGRRQRRPKKIPKSNSSNYPSITFSPNSKLQSQIKISDLQGLVLYLLADGPSPQWISVRHRSEIRKVAVLMVPGLEREMFSKSGPLSKEICALKNRNESKEREYASPDAYYPVRLAADDIPPQLEPFIGMFEYLWPVKTPGDDKYSKMHSPLHAMLTAPLPKSQEEKRKKGVQSAREPQGWRNKRTRITEYILSPEQLLENDYTIHPATYSDHREKSALLDQRRRSETLAEHGWVDTKVDNYGESSLLESEIEQGSLTAGREIVAMDCEMCMTGPNEFSLTRLSLVSWDGSVILDELVKPDKPIVDYVTM